MLATMSYWPRPGKADELYQGLVSENQTLAKHGLRQFALYRNSAKDGPALVWAIVFPNAKAHDAWLNAASKIHESPSEMAADKRVDGATSRMVHGHYLLQDGFTVTPCS